MSNLIKIKIEIFIHSAVVVLIFSFVNCAKEKDFPNFSAEQLNKFQKVEKKNGGSGGSEEPVGGKNNFTDFSSQYNLEGQLINKPNVKAKFTLSSLNKITKFTIDELIIDGAKLDNVIVDKVFFDPRDNITFNAFLSTTITADVLKANGVAGIDKDVPTKIHIIAKFSPDYKNFKTEKFILSFSGLEAMMKTLLEGMVANAYCTATYESGTLPKVIDMKR